MPTDGDTLFKLAEEIDGLGRRLELVGVELRNLRPEQVATPVVSTAPPIPPPVYPWPQQMPPLMAPPISLPVEPVRRPSLVEALGKEGAGSRVLAWVGGAVTLLGIVLLLVLAIQRGWLGPLPQRRP
jgi:uncharacterized membrane protein